MSKFRHRHWLGLAATIVLLVVSKYNEQTFSPDSTSKNISAFPNIFQLNSAAAGNSTSHPVETQDKGRLQRQVAAHEVLEISLTASASVRNPHRSGPALAFTFTGTSGAAQGKIIEVQGFWDGGKTYRARFAPPAAGEWQWTSASNDSAMHGKTGTFNCSGTLAEQHASAHGHVRESKNYPYTFEHDDGTPFFLIGDTQWSFSTAAISWPAEFQGYVDARAAQGFNYVHGVLYQTYPEGNEVNEGGPPFFANNVDSLNPGFWQAFDRRVAYFNSKGIVVGLMFAWGDNAWQLFASREQAERFVRYVVTRYAAYNLFWILAGEYEEAAPAGGYDFIGNLVRAQDPYRHPITIHTVNTSADDFGNTPWHTTIYQQIFHARQVTADRRFNKPVVNSEFGYEGDQAAEEVRQDAWEISMRGGFFVYGDTSTFHYNAVMSQKNLNSPGAAFMTILKSFWTNNGKYSIKWWQYDRFEALSAKRFLAGKTGAEYVAYADTAGSFTVNLAGMSGNIFGQWFDTKTGRWSGTFSGVAGTAFALTPPGRGFVAFITSRADITPPQLVGKPAVIRSLTDFVISWKTDEAATAQVEYGLTSNYSFSTPIDLDLKTSHVAVLSHLISDTTYHYRVLSGDSAGNIAASSDLIFSTRVAAPETVSVAKIVLIDSLRNRAKGVRTGGRFAPDGGWQTNDADDMLMYDLGRYLKRGSLELEVRNFRPQEQNYKERHHILSMFRMPWGNHHPIEALETVWDLHAGFYYAPGVKMLSWTYDQNELNTKASEDWEKDKTYHLKVAWSGKQLQFFRDGVLQLSHTNSEEMELRYLFIGRDYTLSGDLVTNYRHNQYPAMGGPIYSNIVVREWINPADVFPAQVRELRAHELYANAARLEWQTNEPAICHVEYGTRPGDYTHRTPALGPAAQTFSTVLPDLSPQRMYYFRISTLDGSGNAGHSEELAFITWRGGKFLFHPIADAFVERAQLTSSTRDHANFGRMPLILSEGREVYLRFQTGALGNILKTSLRLYSRQSGSSTGVLKKIATVWEESEVTWRTKPSLANEELVRLPNTAAGQWQEVVFAAEAQNNAYNLALVGSGSQLVSYDARESTNHQPELIVLTEAGDVTPPSPQRIGWQEITPTSATIVCSASEPARVQIEFGLGQALDQTTPLSAMLDTTHVIRLTGLLENAAYRFRLKLVDAAGNAALSRPYAVSTYAQVKQLVIASGNGQAGRRGELLRAPLVIKALNAQQGGVANVPIQFEVRYGGGTIFPRYLGSDEPFPHQTGADGNVSVRWQLGKENLQIVEASVLGNPLLSVKFQAKMSGADTTGGEPSSIPASFSLRQFPNPFRASTQFELLLPDAGELTLKIFDLQGREVVTLTEESKSAGRYLVAWNGKNRVNRTVASGIYFAVASFKQAELADAQVQVRKQRLLLLK
jgi:hypothetical protein